MRSTSLIATLAAGLALGATSTASADTFCVGATASCPAGATSEPDIQSALLAARAHEGHDAVRLGAGTFTTSDGWWYNDGNQPENTVNVEGEGDATVLKADQDAKSGEFELLRLDSEGNSRLAKVRVVAPSRAAVNARTVGLLVKGEFQVQDVDVTQNADPGFGASYAIEMAGGDLHGVEVDTPNADGVLINSQPVALYDARIRAERGVIAPSIASVMIRRAAIEARNAGVILGGGVMGIESSLIHVTGDNGIGIKSQSVSPKTALVKASHVTVVGAGKPGSRGLLAYSPDPYDAEIRIDNSIVHAFDRGAARVDPVADAGQAKVTGSHVNYSAANDYSEGDGEITIADVTNLAPGFANAVGNDFRLPRTSSLVDKGRSDSYVFLTAHDLLGRTRSVGAKRDLGAYEHQDAAPVAVVTGAAAAAPGETLAFSGAQSYDIDANDAVKSWTWSFGDGATGSGKNVSHAWAAEGTYEVALTVVDATGKSHTAKASVVVTAAPVVTSGGGENGGGGTGGPNGGEGPAADTLAPAISSLRKRGRIVRLSLSEAAALVVKVERRRGARYRAVGKAMRIAGKAGANSARLAKLRPGRYRLVVTATDAAGNRSAKRLAFRVAR
jgi:hypothetical protein